MIIYMSNNGINSVVTTRGTAKAIINVSNVAKAAPTIEGNSAITATGTTLGTNVTSLTASGKDRDFKVTIVTSGNVAGTLGHVTWSSFTAAPVFTISCANAGTGTAVFAGSGAYIAANANSSTDGIIIGNIVGAGTYIFNCHAGN